MLVTIATASVLATACGGDDSSNNSNANGDGGPNGNGSDGGPTGSGDDGGGNTVPPGSCGMKSPPTGFIAKTSVTVGAASRTYALTVPASYDGTKLLPLVVGFHGDGGNGAQYRSSFGIEGAATSAGGTAIFAWPDGTNNNNGHSFDQDHDPPGNADVDFFEALVAQVSATYCVDSKKVFLHGMSGGAYFANQLARWKAPEIKGVAPQSGGGPFGINGSDFTNGNISVNGQVAAFIVHGDADNSVALSEGQKSLAYWEMADMATTSSTPAMPSPCVKQNGSGAPVYFCKIPGMGHTIWTGAPAGIWQFFSSL